MESDDLNDNAAKEQPCNEKDIINRDLQAAYLWMKKMKDRLEKSKYEESKMCCVDGNGQIVGWTEIAAQSFKHLHSSLLNKNLSDFLKISDGRSFTDVFPLAKPGIPYIINVHFKDGPANKFVYTVKVTRFIFEERILFYLIFYNPLE